MELGIPMRKKEGVPILYASRPTGESQKLQELQHVRKYFPETWIYTSSETGYKLTAKADLHV